MSGLQFWWLIGLTMVAGAAYPFGHQLTDFERFESAIGTMITMVCAIVGSIRYFLTVWRKTP